MSMLGLGLVMALSALALQGDVDSNRTEPIQVTHRYSDKDGNVVELLGVASSESGQTTGWDLAGKPSSSVKDLMDFCRKIYNIEYVYLAPGAKARYVFIRLEKEGIRVEWKCKQADIRQDFYMKRSNSGSTYQVLSINPHSSETALELTGDVLSAQVETPLLKKQSGSLVKALDREFEFGTSCPYRVLHESYSGDRLMPMPADKRWVFVLKGNSNYDWISSSILLGAVSVDKQPILYVDRKGNPVSEKVYKTDPDASYNYNDYNTNPLKKPDHKYQKVYFRGGRSVEGALSLITNINPARVAFLSFSYHPRQTVNFAKIPIDPTP